MVGQCLAHHVDTHSDDQDEHITYAFLPPTNVFLVISNQWNIDLIRFYLEIQSSEGELHQEIGTPR